jgi:F-type H+-transporting ATPase subunit gamma
MAKARAIVKRRKSVRNIRKITKTMQMISTAKFQKSLKRAVGSKPYMLTLREVVAEVVRSAAEVNHPLMRQTGDLKEAGKVAIVVITSNRGLAGAYNGHVLRTGYAFAREKLASRSQVDLYVAGKKGINYFKFQKMPVAQTVTTSDPPTYAEVEPIAEDLMAKFADGTYDAVFVAFMNFISTGVQKPVVMPLLPVTAAGEDSKPAKAEAKGGGAGAMKTNYEFSPSAEELLADLIPMAVKTALFQAFLDATTSEHVARMIAMKSATDNADKMVKSLTMQYNRARQGQITTELSEIMGGVEAMKG